MAEKDSQNRQQLSPEERLKVLDEAERSIDRSYDTGKAERAKITRAAQLDAAEAVAVVGDAMEADEEADDARRISYIAQRSGDTERARKARMAERDARRKANEKHRDATRSARRAYEAIKFSAPNKMGFMRVVQVLFAFHILLVLLSLVMTSRDTVVYDRDNFMTWITIVIEGVAFWLFVNRYKIARPFVIISFAVALVANTIHDIATHTLTPFSLLSDIFVYGSLIAYFSFSRRVKVVLVNDFKRTDAELDEADLRMRRAGWPFFRDLVVYFIVFSVLGHWMEAAMCQLIRLGLVEGEYDPSNTMLWRDWFYPFPMEGAAVVLIAIALYPLYLFLKAHFRKYNMVWMAYVLSFIANALTCSLIEFSMGLIINADHQLWDYTNMFGNIMGQVCLQNTMAFGLAASVITWFVYPHLDRTIVRVPQDVMNIASVIIFVIGGILWSLYLIDPPEVSNKVEKVVATEEEKLDVAAAAAKESLVAIDAALDELEVLIPDVKGVDVSAQLQEVGNMRASIGAMRQGMGLGSGQDSAAASGAPEAQDESTPSQQTPAEAPQAEPAPAEAPTEEPQGEPVPAEAPQDEPAPAEVPLADAA